MSTFELISAQKKDLGGFTVQRILPHHSRRMLGPFIFIDHMGPAEFKPGEGMDVRPHPHINLATVTYLFEGRILHRDSLGSLQSIEPGAVNWMVAGKGIVHSERVHPEDREHGYRLHGLQLWIALPEDKEEADPLFIHYPEAQIPYIKGEGYTARVMIGELMGYRSPVATYSPTLYAEIIAEPDTQIAINIPHSEAGLYPIKGAFDIDGQVLEPGLSVLESGTPKDFTLHTKTGGRMMLFGGEPLGHRHIWWNFVSSRPERIEQAKQDWAAMRMPLIPDDQDAFIPLPEA